MRSKTNLAHSPTGTVAGGRAVMRTFPSQADRSGEDADHVIARAERRLANFEVKVWMPDGLVVEGAILSGQQGAIAEEEVRVVWRNTAELVPGQADLEMRLA